MMEVRPMKHMLKFCCLLLLLWPALVHAQSVPGQVNINPHGDQVVNAQTGTSYPLVYPDGGKLVTFSNASAVAVTLPQPINGQSTATRLGVGWYVDVLNLGAGAVTFTPTSATINSAPTLTLAQFGSARLYSDGTNYVARVSVNTGTLGLLFDLSNSMSPAASATYYGATNFDGLAGSDNNYVKFVMPVTGTVTGFFQAVYVGGTVPSAGSVTTTLRCNGSDTALVVTQDWSTNNVDGAAASDTTHTASVTAGQRCNFKVVTPAWATAPTGVRLRWALRITTP
jgi:hypothetical protein